ncbi:hypothetical protein BAE44_0001758 [Dichanthelium oligosanthes]|uniref:Ubiquitin-like domain-containing protein n=1 Tax=Dichanthelium oligosanthes TaxID=888268 RepID=A0A1E5WIR1_9POAL|nr:hypothetical protein BAE44_0001758 [Dichanthelium oligosanthes]
MSTSSPARAGHGVAEEERRTGTTPVKVGRGVEVERGTGTTLVKVGHRFEEEVRGTGTSPVNVGPGGIEEKERGTGTAPVVKVKAEAGVDGGGAVINIKVKSQTSEDVFFRVKRNVKLRRLMDMYCGKHSLNPRAVKFLDPDGRHILPDQTPDDVGLEDGDEIHIVIDMHGGAGASPVRASRTCA